MVVFEQFHQIGGGAGLEPIVAELFFLECVEQTERIVDAFTIVGKVIAVITGLQLIAGFLVRHFLCCGQFMNFFFKGFVHLFFGYATEVKKTSVHGDVVQIVQVAEHADLSELGNPGEQGELDAAVHGLQHPVEGFQRVAEFALQVVVADGLQQGLVVLVDEDGHALAGLFAGTTKYAGKTQCKGAFRRRRSVQVFPLGYIVIQNLVQTVRCIVLPDVQVQMQHGAFHPVLLQPFHRQSLKEFPLALEVGFQCREKQALAEAARAAQEVITTAAHQLVDKSRFVYIDIAVLA